jgi:hypothetical protein
MRLKQLDIENLKIMTGSWREYTTYFTINQPLAYKMSPITLKGIENPPLICFPLKSSPTTWMRLSQQISISLPGALSSKTKIARDPQAQSGANLPEIAFQADFPTSYS